MHILYAVTFLPFLSFSPDSSKILTFVNQATRFPMIQSDRRDEGKSFFKLFPSSRMADVHGKIQKSRAGCARLYTLDFWIVLPSPLLPASLFLEKYIVKFRDKNEYCRHGTLRLDIEEKICCWESRLLFPHFRHIRNITDCIKSE